MWCVALLENVLKSLSATEIAVGRDLVRPRWELSWLLPWKSVEIELKVQATCRSVSWFRLQKSLLDIDTAVCVLLVDLKIQLVWAEKQTSMTSFWFLSSFGYCALKKKTNYKLFLKPYVTPPDRFWTGDRVKWQLWHNIEVIGHFVHFFLSSWIGYGKFLKPQFCLMRIFTQQVPAECCVFFNRSVRSHANTYI